MQKQHIKGKYLEAAIPEGLHYYCKQICLNQLHPFRWCCCGCFHNFKKEKNMVEHFHTSQKSYHRQRNWAFLQAGHGCSSERPQSDGQNKTCHATKKRSVESKDIRCDSCLLHLMVSITCKHTHECKRGVSAGHSSVSSR